MMKYGKVFKKLDRGNYDFKIVPYYTSSSYSDSYSELIKKQKQDGFRQVLFNVELMLKLINAVYYCNDLHLKEVKMCSDVEKNIQSRIDDLVIDSRKNRKVIFKIVEELEWYSDRESIDIFEIYFYDNSTSSRTVLKLNGIVYGDEIDSLFRKFICPQLKRYFDVG